MAMNSAWSIVIRGLHRVFDQSPGCSDGSDLPSSRLKRLPSADIPVIRSPLSNSAQRQQSLNRRSPRHRRRRVGREGVCGTCHPRSRWIVVTTIQFARETNHRPPRSTTSRDAVTRVASQPDRRRHRAASSASMLIGLPIVHLSRDSRPARGRPQVLSSTKSSSARCRACATSPRSSIAASSATFSLVEPDGYSRRVTRSMSAHPTCAGPMSISTGAGQNSETTTGDPHDCRRQDLNDLAGTMISLPTAAKSPRPDLGTVTYHRRRRTFARFNGRAGGCARQKRSKAPESGGFAAAVQSASTR